MARGDAKRALLPYHNALIIMLWLYSLGATYFLLAESLMRTDDRWVLENKSSSSDFRKALDHD